MPSKAMNALPMSWAAVFDNIFLAIDMIIGFAYIYAGPGGKSANISSQTVQQFSAANVYALLNSSPYMMARYWHNICSKTFAPFPPPA
jgi:hypothetical protein